MVELRWVELLREEVALVVGGRSLLESELPVRQRRSVAVLPVVRLLLEEDLVEVSQCDALRPLQVSQAR